jgi:hypothetical protein
MTNPSNASPQAVGDFFESGRAYSTQNGYTAPETVWSFDCRHVTTTPDGHAIAFGFVRQGGGEEWTPTGLGRADWDRTPGAWRPAAGQRAAGGDA